MRKNGKRASFQEDQDESSATAEMLRTLDGQDGSNSNSEKLAASGIGR